MPPDSTETKNDGFQLDIGHPASRSGNRKRKKSAWVVWVSVCAIAGIAAALAGLGWRLAPEDPSSVTILPIPEQTITQGSLLRVVVAVRRAGSEQGALTYSLGKAPPDATIDAKTGDFFWPTRETHAPGTYQVNVKVSAAGRQPLSDQQTFAVRLDKRPPRPAPLKQEDEFVLPTMGSFRDPLDSMNPFEIEAERTGHGKIDEFVFAKLQQLKIEPSNPCSDAVFLRRAYLDVIGTLPTADEAKRYLDDKSPDKRSVLIDHLLERPEFADYWAMKWSDLLRVKAEFPINLWPNGAQAYHRWIRTSLKENMSYDRFVRELLTACGSNFRTPQVNFFRALQSKEPSSIAQAVALAFMGVRAESWPKERWAGMAVFFSQVGYKPTREWKEEIVVFDPRKAKPAVDGKPPAAVFPDGTIIELPPGRDPREVFADWLIDAKNPWFARHIVNRVWYWLMGRGIVHEADDRTSPTRCW